MEALKIQTTIKNGVITLPLKYRHLNQKAEIIVLAEYLSDTVQKADEDALKLEKKQRFHKALESLKEITAFQEIKDPVKWQREQRDEWER